jgi:hypothetical protein
MYDIIMIIILISLQPKQPFGAIGLFFFSRLPKIFRDTRTWPGYLKILRKSHSDPSRQLAQQVVVKTLKVSVSLSIVSNGARWPAELRQRGPRYQTRRDSRPNSSGKKKTKKYPATTTITTTTTRIVYATRFLLL